MARLNSSNQSSNIYKTLKLYGFFLFFSLPYQIAIFSVGMSNSTGLREAIIRSTLWLIPVLLLPKYTKKLAAVIGILLWSTSIVSWSFFYLYGQDFSQSALFIIFESNLSESKEYLESYIDFGIIALLSIYAFIAVLIWRKLEPVYLPHPNKTITTSLIALIMAWPLLNPLLIKGDAWGKSIDHLQSRLEPAAPWNIIAGYFKYKKVLHAMQEKLAMNGSIEPLEDLKDSNMNKKRTMVLVIGESTNAHRMSLYGYPRKTTPLLDKMQDELVVFKNVISPRPFTIEALEQILTFGDQQHPDEYLTKPTLMNMMKQAGYKSFWITNQQTQTHRNTMLLTFSQQMDEQVYLNNNRVQNSGQFDEDVLKPFKKALEDTADKKFIIVHLLGTHRKYNYRYPKTFEKFTTRQHVPDWVTNDNLDEYNTYDNAVLYNDYVVSSLINTLKNKTPESAALVYFSDHGEEVYDTKGFPFTGRNEDKPTRAMYTVPFMTWLSTTWRSHDDIKNLALYSKRPYLNSDFIYSWADLADIHFKTYDSKRSIFSPDFVDRPRFIGNPFKPQSLVNFDTLPASDITNISHQK